MAEIFSTISMVAFILAGVCVVAAIVLFFALNTKAAYLELKGQPQKKWISGNSKKKSDTSVRNSGQETLTIKMDIEDEAVTTLDNGEAITTVSLMNVYEPGTELMEESTEEVTEIDTNPGLNQDFYEEVKAIGNRRITKQEFRIVKKLMIVHSNELLK